MSAKKDSATFKTVQDNGTVIGEKLLADIDTKKKSLVALIKATEMNRLASIFCPSSHLGTEFDHSKKERKNVEATESAKSAQVINAHGSMEQKRDEKKVEEEDRAVENSNGFVTAPEEPSTSSASDTRGSTYDSGPKELSWPLTADWAYYHGQDIPSHAWIVPRVQKMMPLVMDYIRDVCLARIYLSKVFHDYAAGEATEMTEEHELQVKSECYSRLDVLEADAFREMDRWFAYFRTHPQAVFERRTYPESEMESDLRVPVVTMDDSMAVGMLSMASEMCTGYSSIKTTVLEAERMVERLDKGRQSRAFYV